MFASRTDLPDTGDLAVLGAAVGYSLATVRLEAWTSRLGTLQLAWAKSSGIAGATPCGQLQQQVPARMPCLLTLPSLYIRGCGLIAAALFS